MKRLSLLIIIIQLLGTIPNCISQSANTLYETCSRPFECGNITEIGYPFWADDRPEWCGYPGFQLNCQHDVLRLNSSPISFRVHDIDNLTQTLRISRDDLSNTLCKPLLLNTTFDFTLFDFFSTANDKNITLYYGCGVGQLQARHFNCGDSLSNFYDASGPGNNLNRHLSCNTNITVPVNQTLAHALASRGNTSAALLQEALATGFWIRWYADNDNCNVCAGSGGLCGRDPGSGSFACYCGDGVFGEFRCKGNSSWDLGMNIGLPIVGAILAGVGLGLLIFYCCRQQQKHRLQRRVSQATSEEIKTPSTKPPVTNFTKSNYNLSMIMPANSDLVGHSTYFGVQVFSYAELEEATDKFNRSRVLGDGGYGVVYHGALVTSVHISQTGVLSDGRIVAVKRLYENSFKRVEQFMNEVEILTRLRHNNLVSLYGCTSKRSQELLLVYEYVPNGTVADHLHGKRAEPASFLSWPVRLNIAIETASALDYLHKSDIIHRDVKTNNILLDNEFHVRVADFGLSRLFPDDVTHVSTAPQGTPGYVDPVYYQCYRLTEKSDVYSFGVVLIELISSLQAVDTNRDDCNLSDMAINKIQNHTLHELVDLSLGFETKSNVGRMATLVAELAFRCLQQNRDMRPSMEEVLKALRHIQNGDKLNAHSVEIVGT